MEQKKDWVKDLIVYQVYPRSFQDSNGDGIGDIPGILSRLDHLSALGINALWFPHFLTPALYPAFIDIEGLEQDVLFGIHDGKGVFQALRRMLGGVHMDMHPVASRGTDGSALCEIRS